jgi:hypothetical protein
MRAKHGEVLGHVRSVARIDINARELADVELEGVAVQGHVLQRALGESCLRGRRILDQSGRGVLENKPECVLVNEGSLGGVGVGILDACDATAKAE